MNELFSHHFRGFKFEYLIHARIAIQFLFPYFSNKYVSIFLTSTYVTADTIWSYIQRNLFTDDELQVDKASYSNTLLPLKSLINEVIEHLGIDSEKPKFLSSSTIYEDKNGSMVVATSPRMNPTSKQIDVKYHWFMQHVGKVFVIQKIDSENLKADISTKGLQGQIFVRIRKLICGW